MKYHLTNEEITEMCDNTIDENVYIIVPVHTLRRLVLDSETLGQIRASIPKLIDLL